MKRRRVDDGAVAVFVAVMATLLFSLAALAVDLGNAWARKAHVQTQADVAAISGGALLPMTAENQSAIAAAVAARLASEANRVQGQQAVPVSGPQLLDADVANGELTFQAADGTTCSDDCPRMSLVAPRAVVDFGFASVLGYDETSVTARSTVEIRTPLPEVDGVLPIWLPSSCAYGPVAGDTDTAAPDSSPTYTLNFPRGNHTTTVGTPTASYGATAIDVQVTISDIPRDRTGAVIRFTFGEAKVKDYAATWDQPTSAGDTRVVTVRIGDEVVDKVTDTAGAWQVWPLISQSEGAATIPVTNADYPKMGSHGTFTVTGGGEIACADSQRGNFGQLRSPRQGVSDASAYKLNVALGLDHELVPFPGAASPYECRSDNDPSGAQVDNASRPGNNCLYVDPGNDPNGLTDGLLHGVGSDVDGRLEVDDSTPPSACGRPTKDRAGTTINDDVLSCYLKPGYTLADIAKDSGVPEGALNDTILDSPRFFWAPVVYADGREEKKFLAIKTFAPVFLTDETVSTVATPDNGIVLNSSGKVRSIQLFAFNPAALPVKPNADTVAYEGGERQTVRLVD